MHTRISNSFHERYPLSNVHFSHAHGTSSERVLLSGLLLQGRQPCDLSKVTFGPRDTTFSTQHNCTKQHSHAMEASKEQFAQSVIGKTEEEARALAGNTFRIRVAERDGEPLILTMDYSPQRLNVKVNNGVITGVTGWS